MQQALADALGTVRALITRLLERFERQGWVRTGALGFCPLCPLCRCARCAAVPAVPRCPLSPLLGMHTCPMAKR